MNIYEQIQASQEQLRNIYPHLKSLEDDYGKNSFKHDLLGRPAMIVDMHHINLKSTLTTYFDDNWWYKFHNQQTPREVIDRLTSEYMNQIKFGYFFRFFSIIESEFRILTRKLDPMALDCGNVNNYQLIYRFVFDSMGIETKFDELYGFCKDIRNTIHNNGSHTKNNRVYYFRHQRYELVKGNTIDFFTPSFLYDISNDLIDSLVTIIQSTRFKVL